jgi:hypothetical protein
MEEYRFRPGEPKRLWKLLDVLHLLARSAPKTLIHHDIQSVGGPSATNPATSYRSPAVQRVVLSPRLFAAFLGFCRIAARLLSGPHCGPILARREGSEACSAKHFARPAEVGQPSCLPRRMIVHGKCVGLFTANCGFSTMRFGIAEAAVGVLSD